MKLLIKIVDGAPVGHPYFEENLLQSFPDGIPSEFEPFERVQCDLVPTTYQKTVCVYIKNENGFWQDSWSIQDMTDEEKQIKVSELTDLAMLNRNYRLTIAKREAVLAMARSDLAAVAAWDALIAKLEAYQVISVTPLIPLLPKLLMLDENGNWLQPT
jgi:hypothetical protein